MFDTKHWEQLKSKKDLQEYTFVSNVPLLGSMLTKFRELWSRVAAKWMVLSLMQQQNAFNALLVESLDQLSEQLDELNQRLTSFDHEQVTIQHDIAELRVRAAQMSDLLSSLGDDDSSVSKVE